MPPFRVVVIDKIRDTTTVVVTELDRAPDIGSIVGLPNGDRVTVRHVVSGGPVDVIGVVIAAPA
jgi:hypothetical protein